MRGFDTAGAILLSQCVARLPQNHTIDISSPQAQPHIISFEYCHPQPRNLEGETMH
jgi:hypothetical protein